MSRSDRPLSNQHNPEEGSAIVEFLGLGITLLIPVLYGILTIFSLQSSVMAAHAASAQVVLYVQEQPQDSSVGPDLAQRLAPRWCCMCRSSRRTRRLARIWLSVWRCMLPPITGLSPPM